MELKINLPFDMNSFVLYNYHKFPDYVFAKFRIVGFSIKFDCDKKETKILYKLESVSTHDIFGFVPSSDLIAFDPEKFIPIHDSVFSWFYELYAEKHWKLKRTVKETDK